MNQFTYGSRMPGSDSAFAADDFEPGEIAGMRSAGWILLVSAALTLLDAIVIAPSPAVLSFFIDVFLGVQLLRLRHSWRAWALLRAGVGLLFGVLVLLGGLVAPSAGASLLGLGQLCYCGSLWLLLFGTPTSKRILAGRVAFGASVVLIGAAIVLLMQTRAATHQAANAAALLLA